MVEKRARSTKGYIKINLQKSNEDCDDLRTKRCLKWRRVIDNADKIGAKTMHRNAICNSISYYKESFEGQFFEICTSNFL